MTKYQTKGVRKGNEELSTLTKIQSTMQHKGYKALIRFDRETGDKIFVNYKTPQGCDVKEWSENPVILDELLRRVKDYVSNAWSTKTLWSY